MFFLVAGILYSPIYKENFLVESKLESERIDVLKREEGKSFAQQNNLGLCKLSLYT